MKLNVVNVRSTVRRPGWIENYEDKGVFHDNYLIFDSA